MLTALGLVMLYVAFRFQIKFALGAVIALAHDVILLWVSSHSRDWNLTSLCSRHSWRWWVIR